MWRLRPDVEGNRELSGAVIGGGLAVANGETALVAFDPATGEQRWTLPHPRGPIVAPAIDPTSGTGGVVVFTEGSGATTSVVAVDIPTRTERWRIELRSTVYGAPTVADGTVYFGGRDRFLYAVDVATGRMAWKFRAQGVIDSTPAVADGRVFVIGQDLQKGTAVLYALDAARGSRLWSYSRPGGLGVTAASVSSGRVFAGFSDSSVRAFDARDGTQLWSKAVRAAFAPLSAPAVSGGSVYIADAEGAVYRFDQRRGDRRWEFQLPASNTLAGSPLVAGRWVYMGAADGTVAAIDSGTGRLAWKVRFVGGGAGALTPAGALLLVPIVNRQGGMVALGPDPDGSLIDEESPTTLHAPQALLNFVLAAAAIMVAVLGLFGLLSRLSGPPGEPAGRPGGDDGEDAS